MEAMKKNFSPEFLNRVDETIVFHALMSSEIIQVVDLMVVRVNEQVRQTDMDPEVTLEVKEVLAKERFDPTLGVMQQPSGFRTSPNGIIGVSWIPFSSSR